MTPTMAIKETTVEITLLLMEVGVTEVILLRVEVMMLIFLN